MYIHSYQIHNVLNAYRKQLSKNPTEQQSKSVAQNVTADRITISADGHRPTIMNKISDEIINRIAQFGPQTQFESALANRLHAARPQNGSENNPKETDFTYTLIDDQNRRITNTFPIGEFNASAETKAPQGQSESGMAKELPDENPMSGNDLEG